MSKQVHFVEIDCNGNKRNAGYAPYLDYRSLKEEEKEKAGDILEQASWLKNNIENMAIEYAITELVPRHFEEVKKRKVELVEKTMAAVKDRLTKEINYWDRRSQELKDQERAGKPNARLNSEQAARRAEELAGRLQKRMEELEQEKQLSPLPPVIIGGALVIPAYMLKTMEATCSPGLFGQDTKEVEKAAMKAVIMVEREKGYEPVDVSADKFGYDIESKTGIGKLRFIEVKGRTKGATTVTVTKNEILTALNKPEDFILAIVEIDNNKAKVCYMKKPFRYQPDFAATSVNYSIEELMAVSSEVETREMILDGV